MVHCHSRNVDNFKTLGEPSCYSDVIYVLLSWNGARARARVRLRVRVGACVRVCVRVRVRVWINEWINDWIKWANERMK